MKTTNPKKSFDQRWTSYALAGGAILAAPLGANAGVITPTEPIHLFSTTVPVSAFLDIDGDGTDDYELVADGGEAGPPFIRSTYVNALNGNLIYGTTVGPLNTHHATAFNVGETPSGPTISGGGLFLSDKFKSPTTKGEWPNDASQLRLLGVRFTSSSQNYEGWVKVGVELGSATMDITEWAFEAAAVPEPSSMGLMLLGAAGIAALKRRRKAS